MKVAVIKYNAGNIQSVLFALQRLGVDPVWTDDPAMIKAADKVIFPGQGEASNAMRYLRERGLDEVILSLTQPVLGICIGLQLLCKHSTEGNTTCLGVFNEEVIKFGPGLKVPHIGWNTLENMKGPLMEGITAPAYLYYVHSYYAKTGKETIATTNYMVDFSAVLQKNNFYAVQAHPEKSGKDGEMILKNFLALGNSPGI